MQSLAIDPYSEADSIEADGIEADCEDARDSAQVFWPCRVATFPPTQNPSDVLRFAIRIISSSSASKSSVVSGMLADSKQSMLKEV